MNNPPCILYQKPLVNLSTLLVDVIERSIQDNTVQLFFRADDIGISSDNFKQLIRCFNAHEIPLCLATVPTWLTRPRLISLENETGTNNPLYCWHQHGWLHKNYQVQGKKEEFGSARSEHDVYADLKKGKERLERLLQDSFHPVFTPPWNRCSKQTIDCLTQLNFKAISRSKEAIPQSPIQLPDIPINIDIHTRKEAHQDKALESLLAELHMALQNGQAGIMIHHQRMNQLAFTFIEALLQAVKNHRGIQLVTFASIR